MSNNLCETGNKQSPIDIIKKNTQRCATLCDLVFYYRTSKCVVKNINNDDIVLDYDVGSNISYNNTVYELLKINFTIPSSHKFDSYSYPGEIHLYHRAPDSGKLLVVAIMMDINDATSKSTNFLDIVKDSIPQKNKTNTVNTSNEWTAYNLIPEIQSFFIYEGSLVKSPCTQSVTWLVFENPINCSTGFFDKLKSIIKNNSRAIQDTNDRNVYYNPNNSSQNTRNYGDKLRCYTNKEFDEKCAKSLKIGESLKETESITKILFYVIGIIAAILGILYLHSKGFFNDFTTKVKDKFTAKVFNGGPPPTIGPMGNSFNPYPGGPQINNNIFRR